jgi:hypothetical protein
MKADRRVPVSPMFEDPPPDPPQSGTDSNKSGNLDEPVKAPPKD